MPAYRAAYELYRGKIPTGMSVCHTCDNPACVNPNHLFLGTQRDNMLDMFRKGRGIRGTRVHGAKLNDQIVKEIIEAKGTNTDIAKLYGVSRPTVSYIKSGHTWKHVERKIT